MNDRKERVYSEQDLCEYTILQKIEELERQLQNLKSESGLYETKLDASTSHTNLSNNIASVDNNLQLHIEENVRKFRDIDNAFNHIDKFTPTDVGIKNNKLGLQNGSTWLTNRNAINIGDGLSYDETTNTLKASGGGSGIPVVDGTITTEYTFALNETPTGDYFLAHLLYAGFVYINSLMTKTTLTFGETNIIFYIGLIVLNGVPFLAYSVPSEDGNSVNNVMKQICFMNNPYQSNGIIYFTNGGFDSIPLPDDASTSTYVLKAVNGTVQWVK